ncbi:thioesterase, partial [Xanthomonas perforans]
MGQGVEKVVACGQRDAGPHIARGDDCIHHAVPHV